ncbi:MAG: hypothetical protein ACKPA7_05930 [Sphaerospermopsis kisseleviana]
MKYKIELSCYTAKLYNPNILNSCGTRILPVPLIQIKCTTAYHLGVKQYKARLYLSQSMVTKLWLQEESVRVNGAGTVGVRLLGVSSDRIYTTEPVG